MKHLGPFSILVALLSSIYYTSAASSNILVQDPSKDNSQECSCYLTSGPSSSYFQHHRFWDFRSIPSDGKNDFTLPPPFLNNSDDLTNAPPSSTYLSTTDFVTDWSIQNWTADADTFSPISRINSAQNVFISRNTTLHAESSTYLTLRASRLESFMSIAELESKQKNLLHSSIRARMRIIPLSPSLHPLPPLTNANSNSNSNATTSPLPAPGAVAALFTYHSTTSESDIEILTRDPTTQIRYANQPDDHPSTGSIIPGASTQSTLPGSKQYTEWLTHRIDWLDGISRWYVDGELVLEKRMNVPREPSGLILNLWGDGGRWSGGGMAVGDGVALGVEWVEMSFNVSGPVGGGPHPQQPKETKEGGGGGSSGGPAAGGKDGGVAAAAMTMMSLLSEGKDGGVVAKRGTTEKEEEEEEEEQRGDGAMCEVACQIDGVALVGFPELAFNAAATSSATTSTGLAPSSGGVVVVVVVGSPVRLVLLGTLVLAALCLVGL